MDRPYTHRLRVRYCETDRMGVAHHGSYIDWFEEARTEWLRALGKTYRELEDEGSLLQVVEVNARYLRSVTYDDEIEIEVRRARRQRASVTIEYVVRMAEGGEKVCEASTRLACVDRDGKLKRLPDVL